MRLGKRIRRGMVPRMNPDFYLRLLNLIEDLAREIVEVNPGCDVSQLDADIQQLYNIVNSYQPHQKGIECKPIQ